MLMLLKVAQEELVVLKDLIKEADTKYHDILDMGCMVPLVFLNGKNNCSKDKHI